MALPINIFNKKILYQDPRTDGGADIGQDFMHTTTGSCMLRKNQIEGFKWCILAIMYSNFGNQ